MFAWILKTNPEKFRSVGSTGPTSACRGPGLGASVNSAWRNGSTPKSFNALPKNTGVWRACR